MSLFLSDAERTAIQEARRQGDVVVGRFWTALTWRAARRAASPGLVGLGEDAEWWYPAAEYLSDAAMAFALEPTESLRAWIRDTALSVARRPVADWVGPWYRDHRAEPPLGHLETAHLCWGLGSVVDLAGDVFRSGERRELADALREKGIALCARWLERNSHLANWRAVMTAGMAVAAAVLGDREHLEYAAGETRVCAQAFQPDASYAESLQYANYLAYALMMAYEAVHRAASEVVDVHGDCPDFRGEVRENGTVPLRLQGDRHIFRPEAGRKMSQSPPCEVAGPEAYGRCMTWFAQSMLYRKPLSGWGAEPRARAVNFNDCGALFRPSGDLLLQVAARCRDSLPTEAGLARWLFDTFYAPVPSQPPHNLATFGLRNDWGFLTLPFLTQSARPLSPEQAGFSTAAGFTNGNVLVRDQWNGRTVLAVQGGSGPLHGPGHLHGDVNSFILVHNRERLLVDPGHSCYRNLIHGLESSTQTHNTCTFLIAEDALGLQEDLAKASLLEQSNVAARREISEGKVAPPVAPRGKRLLVERSGEVTAVGSDAAQLYGEPIEEFARFWIQAGSHVLFVVDRIRASRPVRTVWNWLLNNRDGASEIDVITPTEILLRRGLAGMKMTHLGEGRLSGPVHAYVHDAYHPKPNQLGEGRPTSGMLYRWIEPAALKSRLVVHTFAVDDYGLVGGWQLETSGDTCSLGIGDDRWSMRVAASSPLRLILECTADQRRWQLIEAPEGFSFARIENG